MSPLEQAVKDLRASGWSRIAGELAHVPLADLPLALQQRWLFITLFPMDDFVGRLLGELGRRALERLARELGVNAAGARVPLDVVRLMPRRVLS